MFCNKFEIVRQYNFFLLSIPQFANGNMSYSDIVQSDTSSFNGMIKKFDKEQQTELKQMEGHVEKE